MSAIPLGLLGGGLAVGGHYLNKGPLTTATPNPESAVHSEQALFNALDKYVKREAPDNPITDIVYKQPSAEVMKDASKAFDKEAIQFAGAGIDELGRPVVQFNNKAPAPLLAHELGHVAFGQTPFGSKVQDTRRAMSRNPALRRSLYAASLLVPGAAAALTPGDEDLTASVGLSLLLDSPALIDEFEANRRSLSLMKDAGVKMTNRDRARMAGSLLSYLGRPLALAASGNLAGNLLDENV